MFVPVAIYGSKLSAILPTALLHSLSCIAGAMDNFRPLSGRGYMLRDEEGDTAIGDASKESNSELEGDKEEDTEEGTDLEARQPATCSQSASSSSQPQVRSHELLVERLENMTTCVAAWRSATSQVLKRLDDYAKQSTMLKTKSVGAVTTAQVHAMEEWFDQIKQLVSEAISDAFASPSLQSTIATAAAAESDGAIPVPGPGAAQLGNIPLAAAEAASTSTPPPKRLRMTKKGNPSKS